jgi:alanyl aminopeptidase
LKEHFDDLRRRLPSSGPFSPVASFPYIGADFCDEAHRADVEAFFRPWVSDVPGAPRNLEKVLEEINLCAHERSAQETSIAKFLEGEKTTP